VDASTIRKALLLAVIALGLVLIGAREVFEHYDDERSRPGMLRGRLVFDGGTVAGARLSIDRAVGGTDLDGGTFETKVYPNGGTVAKVRVWGSAASAGFPLRSWELEGGERSVPFGPTQEIELGDLPLKLVPSIPPGKIGLAFFPDAGAPLVLYVADNAPASLAGIQRDDLILEVDGVAVGSIDEAMARIPGEPGTTVTIKLRRGEQDILFDIVRMAG
jgi:PDZ domain